MGIEKIKIEFTKHGGILKTSELSDLGISSRQIKKLLMDKMQVSRKQVQNALKVLSERGSIKRIGPNRSGYWKVNE